MTAHLWQAAEQKARAHARRGWSHERGELGLNIDDWVQVLQAANCWRLSRIAGIGIGVVIGLVLGWGLRLL